MLRLSFATALAIAAGCTKPATAAPTRAPVRYGVALPDPASQYVHVTLTVDDPQGRHSDVAMPAWAPGSYLIRDFARHVYDLEARDADGDPLAVERRDKQTWRVEHGGRPFTVTYRVYAAEISVRTSHVDDRHASLIGTSIFMYIDGELTRPATVEVSPPSGWSVHVALPSQPAKDGRVSVEAPSYDALVDAPLELGTPHVETFEVDGTQFEYVLTGADTLAADPRRLAREAKRVVASFGVLMGGFPMKRYVFLAEATGSGGGGLEHANSTSMMLRRGMFEDEDGYASAARLVAHEFFHLWNVKRIHDQVLGPFDYSKENYTRLLWFHEGFTETMESIALRRAGMITGEAFVRGLGRHYTRYRARPGRNHDPLSQLSYEAWIKGYQPADNHRNVAISYYTKGDLVGIALDLELRLRSRGKGSLPGLFRRLMQSHGQTGRGITMADIVDAADAEAGEPMRWFFDRYVDGTEEVPLPELLAKIGVGVQEAAGDDPYTGLRLDRDGTVDDIEPGSPAAKAGFMRGDRLLTVDGQRADQRDEIERWVAAAGTGATVEVELFRDDRRVRQSLTIAEDPYRTWSMSLPPLADPDAKRLRDAWLTGR